MARTFGATAHTKNEFDFIKSNWRNMDDCSIGRHLGFGSETIQKMRLSIGLSRRNLRIGDPKTIALVLEKFANGSTVAQISKLIGKNPTSISDIIKRNFFFKKRSYDTIILVIESKASYPNEVVIG